MKLSYEGDAKKAASFTGKVQQELDRLQARLSSSGLDRGSFQHVLDDTSYAYGYILPGGLRVAHIVTSEGVSEALPLYDTTETKTPDFLSGYVGNGLMQAATPATDDAEAVPALLRNFTPSLETARVHAAELTRLPKVERLAVYPWSAFDAVGLGTEAFAQTQTLYPTMYSGKMRKVVQALMGFGKQPDGDGDVSIFDAVDPDYEAFEGEAPEEAQTRYEIDVEANGLQVRYDYRFMRTHGIVVSADARLWLVEIGMNRGIIAMQLPFHEHTTTVDFIDQVYQADRMEAITLLDELGGFPTGEAFPNTPEGIDANIRAGRVVRLKTAEQMADFYSYTGYSSAMGWAFNERGTEAHNTCWKYGEDGVQRGAHFAVSLAIGDFIAKTPPAAAEGLKEIAAEVQSQRAERYDAFVFKVDRMTDDQLDFLISDGMTSLQIFDAIDAVELEPCAVATAGISKCSESKIYWPTPLGQPQIKFPEPILGGLISHDMRPSTLVDSNAQSCDTLMHVFFSGDDLKWVKFYLKPSNWRTGWTWEGDDEFDVAYAPAGNFYRAYVYGPVGVPPMFYTNDFDPREELPVSKFEWFYRRQKIGFTDPWNFSDSIAQPPTEFVVPPIPADAVNSATPVCLYRTCWFTNDYDFHFSTSKSLSSAVAVPFYDREGYYFSTLRKRTGGDIQYVVEFRPVNDPNIGWRNMDSTAIVENAVYPGGQSVTYDYQMQFVDQGPWAPIGADLFSFRTTNNDDPYHQDGGLYSSVVVYNPAEGSLVTKLVTSSNYDVIEIESESKTGDENVGLWEPLWFLPSPDEFGDYQFIGETNNALGDVECIVFGTHLTNGARDVRGAPVEAKDATYYPCFIGPYNA